MRLSGSAQDPFDFARCFSHFVVKNYLLLLPLSESVTIILNEQANFFCR